MIINRILLLILVVSIIPGAIYSQDYSNYLILQDIGLYKLETPQKVVGGYIGGPRVFDGAGVIAPTGHFYPDHNDKTYEVYYEGGSNLSSPTIQVTQHAGSESDQWLKHEVERDFRNYYGLPGESFIVRQIDNNTVLTVAIAGWAYRWISGNKVIQISYHDSQMEKPEPLEVVSAYLAKHPSTLTPVTSADLRTASNKTTWIKDEMERRLWLCDKWFYELQKETVEIDKVIRNLYDHMKVFLDYREKYYGISAKEEKLTLWRYKQANNGTGIKNKLAEYKIWWKVNKDKSIDL